MSSETQEGYARLPEDLLRDLLAGAGAVVDQVTAFLGPALDAQDELREALEDLGLVRAFNAVAPQSVAGIDGGFAVERTAAVDLSLSVAVGVEGLSDTTTQWDSTQYLWWSRVTKHDMDAERLTRGVMIGQELAILRRAPHSWRILDGSHLTLVIQLNTAMTAFSDDVRAEALRVWTDLETPVALAEAVTAKNIVAMPKYDSSRAVAQQLESKLNRDIPGDDKYLLGLLLKPGELILPQIVPQQPWSALHLDARGALPGEKAMQQEFEKAIEPLRSRVLCYTYFKPDDFSPAFRIEIKDGLTDAQLDEFCSTISRQITGPFVREPYPQYLADVMAKSVGLGLSALQTAVQLGLSGLGRPEMAELLIRSYRTEGV
ncbi:MAG: DNA double-strand break repair nuclease NurA [Dehalococcoidia bacterium]